MRIITLATVFALALVGLAYSLPASAAQAKTPARTALARAALPRGTAREFGTPPAVPSAAPSPQLQAALDASFGDIGNNRWGDAQREAIRVIGASGDPRQAWLILDLMRFITNPELIAELVLALNSLLDVHLDPFDAWQDVTERLIAWDIAAPPDYLRYKRAIYTAVFPEWEALFHPGDIDWRHVTWGGVRIDDRAFDQTDAPCNCIPAADNPPVSSAEEATWLDDDAIVFGIGINGEYRAYPRQIMEVREMVNDTLGGRDLGIPYCTLCGSAQAWFTDRLPDGVERPVLRTSGLLIRANKVMYDLTTHTVFDTFLGTAVAGPLAERGVQLTQASVVTTTWSAWKAAHPQTTVLVERLALGRNFDFRNGRDANGPIFPIGDVDPRLPVQEDVLGVITPGGSPLAFHVPSLVAALDAGESVHVDGVEVVLDALGVRAVDASGNDLGTHQAFWFAWSQFHPGTRLWPESR
ncbi:MAG: DUF3179 domain-containing (seleno)protein [Pseudomonadota bacterium]